MADYYIKITGSGSGAGTSGDPWTMQQFVDTEETTLSHNDNVHIGAGTHTLTTTWNLTVDGVNYYGDTTSRPVIQWQNTLNYFLSKAGNDNRLFDHIIFDCNGFQSTGSQANYVAFSREQFSYCKFISVGTDIPQFNGDCNFFRCEFSNGSRLHGGTLVQCAIHGMTGTTGAVYASRVFNCALYNNAVGIASTSSGQICQGSFVYGNTNDMKFTGSGYYKSISNNVFGDMTGNFYLYKWSLYNNLYESLVGSPNLPRINLNPTVMAADPFTDAANGDFRLTAAAKQTAYVNDIRRIMAMIKGVPSIQVDDDFIGVSQYRPFG